MQMQEARISVLYSRRIVTRREDMHWSLVRHCGSTGEFCVPVRPDLEFELSHGFP